MLKQALGRLVATSSRALNRTQKTQRLAAYLLEQFDTRVSANTQAGKITFRASNSIECYRAQSLRTKEPETITWLHSTLKPDSVFFDVGANVGSYALYAWRLAGCRCVCFEPVGANIATLLRNIEDNGAGDKISAYAIALSDASRVETITLSSLEAGAAKHHPKFGADRLRQGVLTMSLDAFMEATGLPQPTHLKIDVDGPELAVLAGATSTLAGCSHVLIELDATERIEATRILAEAGLVFMSGGTPVDGIANCIFTRSNGLVELDLAEVLLVCT